MTSTLKTTSRAFRANKERSSKMKTLPTLIAIFTAFCLAAGIVTGSVFLISASMLLLLLVLPALCSQIYEMTPSYKRKHEQ